MTELRVVRRDITASDADAIVNAANSGLLGGSGVDGAIHDAGGPAILEECRQLVADRGMGCDPGDAVITGAGNLKARWVIHAVGPIWNPAEADECDLLLASAYRRSLEEADRVGAGSVAFPNISTGVYGYPKARAADVVASAIDCYLTGAGRSSIELIDFVCFDDDNFDLYAALGYQS